MGDKGRNPYRKIRSAKEAEAAAKLENQLAGVAEPNPFELAILGAEHSPHTPEINLHGQTAQNARRALELFLDQEFPKSTEVVRIIHGKGTGTLHEIVNKVLAEKQREGLIAFFRSGTSTRDAGAVVYAVFAE